jgi:aminopeptidase-like protein
MSNFMKRNHGDKMYSLAKELWPIHRSITGNGVRETLSILKKNINDLKVREVETGTKIFDWKVPKEWNVNKAYIKDDNGNIVVDCKINNLHLVSYSVPVNKVMSLGELSEHIHTLPEQPDAIPYVTSYYKDTWGFCMTHNDFLKLRECNYKVCIDTALTLGKLTYGEVYISSTTNGKQEVFLSTYVCHPSMANNELSGPVLMSELCSWLQSLESRKYNYRIVFLPETIGSIAYLSRHLDELKNNVVAGYNLTCVGDDRCYSYVQTRNGNTLSDKIIKHVLKNVDENYKEYTFLHRGSDERQYCSPNIDLPISTFCRSKFQEYPEYHTSLDDLNFISPTGLQGSFDVMTQVLSCIENNIKVQLVTFCEPFLTKYGMYPTLSCKMSPHDKIQLQMNVIAYADGRSVYEIAELLGVAMWDVLVVVHSLIGKNILRVI